MNRSTFRMIKYMNGSVFSKARYMNGVGFEILARTPVHNYPPPPPLLPHEVPFRRHHAKRREKKERKAPRNHDFDHGLTFFIHLTWEQKAENGMFACAVRSMPYISIPVKLRLKVINLFHFLTKPTKWHVRTAMTQIRLGISPVWSESSLCAQRIAKDPNFLHADSEDWSDWADARADPSLR